MSQICPYVRIHQDTVSHPFYQCLLLVQDLHQKFLNISNVSHVHCVMKTPERWWPSRIVPSLSVFLPKISSTTHHLTYDWDLVSVSWPRGSYRHHRVAQNLTLTLDFIRVVRTPWRSIGLIFFRPTAPLLQRSHIGRPPFMGSDLGVPTLWEKNSVLEYSNMLISSKYNYLAIWHIKRFTTSTLECWLTIFLIQHI